MGTQKKNHGKRRRRYQIEYGRGVETVNAAEWNRARADGWIVPVALGDGSVSDRIARLADGIVAKLRDGILWLRNLRNQSVVRIYTSWLGIDRIAPPRGPYYEDEIRRQYVDRQAVTRDSGLPWWERCPGAT